MRVSDIGGLHHLVICCTSPLGCTHSVELTPDEAVEVLGADAPLERIRKTARCSRCGHKGAMTICLYRGPTG